SINAGGFSLLAVLPAHTTPAPSVMTYTDTGLTPGSRYDYHVQAFNLAGYSDFAGVSTATLTVAPTGLTAAMGGGGAVLAWTAPAGAASFSVYRGSTGSSGGATLLATNVAGTTFTDPGPIGATTYYQVSAVNTGGESARSIPVSPNGLASTTTSITESAD